MAKKEKVIIKDEALVPTIIGKVENKQIGLIYLFFVFVALISFVYFMPDIITYFEEEIGEEVLEEEIKEEEVLLIYSSGMSIESDLVTLENVVLTDYTLSFDIKNNGSTRISLENNNRYLEVYDVDNNLLSRMSFSGIIIEVEESYSYVNELLYNDISYFEFKEIDYSDYEDITLSLDEYEEENLVCIKDDTVLTYKFSDNLLKSVLLSKFIEDDDELDYESYVDKYNTIEGVDSVYRNGTDGGFYIYIDLALYDDDIFGDFYLNYEYKEEAKVINFEMISEGFVCN